MLPMSADAPFLQDLLNALRRRQKAFAHKGVKLIADRVIEEKPDGRIERIDLVLRLRKRQIITLTIKQDRTVRLHACEAIAKAGWRFQYTSNGRLLGTQSGRDLVEAMEATASSMFGMTDQTAGSLSLIWDQLLARGPQSI
jgi:hypothetical protein